MTAVVQEADLVAFRGTARRVLETADRVGLGAVAGEYGLLGVGIAEQHGGAGVDDLSFGVCLVDEAMALGLTGFAVGFLQGCQVISSLLARHGSLAQQQRWLPGIAAGTTRAVLVGLDLPAASRPEITGGGLFGAIPAALGAADAHLLVVVAGEQVLLVPAVEAVVSPREDQLLIPGLGSADLRFDGAVITPAHQVAGAGLVGELRADQDLWASVVAVAGARAALRGTLDYVRDRKVFGQPLAAFENTRVSLAEVAMQLELADAMVAVCLAERALGPLGSGRAAACVLGAVAAQSAVVDQCLQLHGGYGYMREYPIAQAFSDAAALRRWAAPGAARQRLVAASLGMAVPDRL